MAAPTGWALVGSLCLGRAANGRPYGVGARREALPRAGGQWPPLRGFYDRYSCLRRFHYAKFSQRELSFQLLFSFFSFLPFLFQPLLQPFQQLLGLLFQPQLFLGLFVAPLLRRFLRLPKLLRQLRRRPLLRSVFDAGEQSPGPFPPQRQHPEGSHHLPLPLRCQRLHAGQRHRSAQEQSAQGLERHGAQRHHARSALLPKPQL